MIEGQKFARKCSVTGEGMDEGWVFRDGDMYFINKDDVVFHVQTLGYNTLEEAYDKDEIYWTSWYVEDPKEDDHQYIVKNGELVEID